jgi:ferric-dicitrate binding protein FerR (iron transport regulator)
VRCFALPTNAGCKSGATEGFGFTQLAASPTWRNLTREIASAAVLRESISAADLDEARQQLKLGIPGAEDATALEQRIGNTVIVKNQVDQLTGAAAKSISVGDNVFLDETVQTGQDSTGKFVLSDATNLAMGPKSTVKLDRFVFSGGGESTYSKAVLSLTKGTFRFITGNSAKTAYEIDTPTASIGVRGTIVDIKIDKGGTTVALQEGNATVCQRHTAHCAAMTPGQTVSVTTTKNITKVTLAPSTWTFASTCGGSSALCGQTTVAQAAAVQQQVAQGSSGPCAP